MHATGSKSRPVKGEDDTQSSQEKYCKLFEKLESK